MYISPFVFRNKNNFNNIKKDNNMSVYSYPNTNFCREIDAKFYQANYAMSFGQVNSKFMLNKIEIEELVKRIQQSNGNLKEDMGKLYETLNKPIEYIAWKFSARGCDKEDLTQGAFLGLIKAVKNWKKEKAPEFIPYALTYAKYAMIKMVYDSDPVAYSKKIKNLLVPYLRTNSILEQDLNRKPTAMEIYKKMLEMPEIKTRYDGKIETFKEDYPYLIQYVKKSISLQSPVNGDEGALELFIPAQIQEVDKIVENKINDESCKRIIKSVLNGEEATAVEEFYVHGAPIEKIAHLLDTSEKSVVSNLVSGLKTLIKYPLFLNTKKESEVNILNTIINRYEIDSYNVRLKALIPEFAGLSEYLREKNGKQPKLEDIKAEIKQIVGSINLTNMQKIIVSLTCGLQDDGLGLKQDDIGSIMNIPRKKVSDYKENARIKIKKAMLSKYDLKSYKNYTLQEILLFSSNLNELFKKAGLNGTETKVMENLISVEDAIPQLTDIAKKIGHKNSSDVWLAKESATKKIFAVVENDKSFMPEFSNLSENNYEKIKKCLTPLQSKIFDLRNKDYKLSEMIKELGVAESTITTAQRAMITKFEKLFPNLQSLKVIVRKSEDNSYLGRVTKYIPEVMEVKELLTQKLGREPSEVEIKSYFKEIIDFLDLSESQRQLFAAFLEFDGSIVKTLPELAEKLGISSKLIDFDEVKIKNKLKMFLLLHSKEDKPSKLFSIQEFLLFSKNKDEIIKKANLSDKEEQILRKMINIDGTFVSIGTISKEVNIGPKSLENSFIDKILLKIVDVISNNKAFAVEIPNENTLQQDKNLDLILKVLQYDKHRQIVKMVVNKKSEKQIVSELKCSKSEIPRALNAACEKLKKYCPRCYEKIKNLLEVSNI